MIRTAENFNSFLIKIVWLCVDLAYGQRRGRGPRHSARRHPNRLQVHIAGTLGPVKQPKLISRRPVYLHVPPLTPINLSGRLPQKVSRLRHACEALLPREAGSGERAEQAHCSVQLLPEVYHYLDLRRCQGPLFQQLHRRKRQKSGVATFYSGEDKDPEKSFRQYCGRCLFIMRGSPLDAHVAAQRDHMRPHWK